MRKRQARRTSPMAKTIAPLLSFDASGQIGSSQVYSTWKGVKYARRYVIPSNPKSVAQVAQRNMFAWVHDAYKYLDAAVTSAWVLYAKGKPLTGPNAWQQKNLVALKGQTVITDIIFIPAVAGGPPNQATALTPGSGQITAVGTPPTLPTGWSIVEMVATAMKQQDPSGETEPNISFTMTKSTTPWSVVFTGLAHSQAYVVGIGWALTRSDMTPAYGGSTNALTTTT